jgi:hypothetical protein
MRPFAGLIDPVIIEAAEPFDFPGAVPRQTADAVSLWMARDLGPDLLSGLGSAAEDERAVALDAAMSELLARAREAIAAAAISEDAERRLRVQLGSEETRRRLPSVLVALKCRAVIGKSRDFGRAANAISEEASLAMALQSMPLQDPSVAALLMQAAMGEVAQPGRIVSALGRITNSPSEAAVTRAGFAPLIEALLAHAQNQLQPMRQAGPFRDIDRCCAAVERFHRLSRAVAGYIEMSRTGRWAMVVAGLTRAASEAIEPQLRDIVPEVNHLLRGGEASEHDQSFHALNGMYLLATVRDCRDSLALNTLIEPLWVKVGQAIDIHTRRHLETLRANPGDALAATSLEAGIKLAELRFGAEHAEILRKARETTRQRTH